MLSYVIRDIGCEQKWGSHDAPDQPKGNRSITDTPPFFEELSVVGVSHKSSPLEVRSRLSFSADHASTVLGELVRKGAKEAVYLNTCNRSELYVVGLDSSVTEQVFLESASDVGQALRPHLHSQTGAETVEHFFRVASGLESAVLGENEILSQIKSSWMHAAQAGFCGSDLQFLLSAALRTSKRVRSQTQIDRGVTSVASLAVVKASERVGGFDGKNIALVGAGITAERIAKDLANSNPSSLSVCNRTKAHAARLAGRYGGTAYTLADLRLLVDRADVVFVALNTDEVLVGSELFKGREAQAIVVVDLGVPCNTDARVRAIPGVSLIEMQELEASCAQNSEMRAAEIPKAEEIVREECERFALACMHRDASAAIKALQSFAMGPRELTPSLITLNSEDRLLVEELSSWIQMGLLNSAVERVKETTVDTRQRALIAHVFGTGSS